MQSIKAIRVEVISHTIASPTLSPSRVGAVALCHSPSYTQVGGLRCHKRFHIVHHHLIIPFLILGGPLACTQEDVGSYTVNKSGKDISTKSSLTKILVYSKLHLYILSTWWHSLQCWSAATGHDLEAGFQWWGSGWTSQRHHYIHRESARHPEPKGRHQIA